MPRKGWEKSILPRGVRLLDEVEPPDPLRPAEPLAYDAAFAWGEDGANQGSPNHEAEAWSIEAVRAVRRGTRRQSARALAVLKSAYLDRELRRIGLWKSEQLCPAPHGGQHLVGVSMTRLAAWESGDAGLLEDSEKLLRCNARLLLSVATPDLAPLSAGFRARRTPSDAAAAAWLRQLRGAPHTGDLVGRNAEASWRSPFYLAARTLRYLQRLGDPAVAPRGEIAQQQPGPVLLKFETIVYRAKRRHLVIIPPNAAAPRSGVCDWLSVNYRPGRRPAVECGFDWKTPPPQPPRGVRPIRHPGSTAP